MTGTLSVCIHQKSVCDKDLGEQICINCGEVLEQKMNDERAESSYDSFMENTRTGPATSLTMHNRGLSTIIGKSNHDFVGKPLGYQMKHFMNRMRLWDSRSQVKTTSERNLKSALYEMGKLKEKMDLSDAIIERAAYLYRKAAKARLVRGRTIKSVVGACMYVACRDMDTTRTIIDIADHLQERRKLIAKSYRMLFQNLRLTVSITDPINSIIKFANNLQLPEITKREAIKIFDVLKEKELTAGKKPDAVAATIIYMACIRTNVNLSQSEISRISGISKVTIRNRFNDFRKYVKLV
ncbi:MAG TPA: transcription initiation factor IIB [Nitrosarchaeum sp.]